MSQPVDNNLRQRVDAIILCGGAGKRLHQVTHDKIPKSLHEVNSMALMKYTLDSLPSESVGRLIFMVGHHADMVRDWVERANLPHEVVLLESTEGVLNAVVEALEYVQEESVIICNTDEIRDGLDVDNLIQFHLTAVNDMTMPYTMTDNLYRHRLLKLNSHQQVIDSQLKSERYREKPHQIGPVNIGFILINKSSAKYFDTQFGNDWSAIIDPFIKRKLCTAFETKAKYFNIGTAQEIRDAINYIATITSANIKKSTSRKKPTPTQKLTSR